MIGVKHFQNCMHPAQSYAPNRKKSRNKLNRQRNVNEFEEMNDRNTSWFFFYRWCVAMHEQNRIKCAICVKLWLNEFIMNELKIPTEISDFTLCRRNARAAGCGDNFLNQ